MGNCFSCRSSSSSFTSVRIVHLNGYIEDFQPPITAQQVTADLPKHFLCTMAHLIHGSKAIRPQVQLETGRVYFLLPYSILRSDSSPANMVALATKLNAFAKSSRPCLKPQAVIGDLKVISTNCEHSLRPNSERTPSAVPIWKPILDAIVEKSMEHPCE